MDILSSLRRHSPRELFVTAAAFALKNLKTQHDLDSLLLFGARNDKLMLVDACRRAGANIHVAHDDALYSASLQGYARIASSLLRSYDPERDAPVLERFMKSASLFGHWEVVRAIREKLENSSNLIAASGPA